MRGLEFFLGWGWDGPIIGISFFGSPIAWLGRSRYVICKAVESDALVTWQPIHPNHAIERARIVVQFKDKLPQKTIKKLGEAFESVRGGFGFGPRVEIQTHTLLVGPAGPSSPMVSQEARGWQFVREAAPGAVLEVLVLDTEGFVYENVEYARWSDFWGRASEILLPLVGGVAEVADLRLFSLEYFDRFNFEGVPSDADPTKLIGQELVETLSGSARSGSELWHIHRGWYETADGIRVLINQNIDANDSQNTAGEPARTVTIYTKVERRNREEIVDARLLSEDIVKMHNLSKSVFATAITNEIQGRISLDASTNS